jgi:hypothetical protein
MQFGLEEHIAALAQEHRRLAQEEREIAIRLFELRRGKRLAKALAFSYRAATTSRRTLQKQGIWLHGLLFFLFG